ncbi:DUF445 domain-containing protein [Desulforudis sp. 1088]|uniref:DUF445 domain-containing protein n=1 Tax=unclassified Candidatus Desulforudis TaxID=2635950 RepID=UPI003481CE8D
MFWLSLISIPFIGALIGWFTNLLAVKMIFRPYKPVRFGPIVVQGLLPKRRYDLARTIGEVVETDLFSVDDLLVYVETSRLAGKLTESVRTAVHDAVVAKSPALLPLSLKRFFAEFIAEIVADRVPEFIEKLIDELSHGAQHEIKISRLIEERLNSFPLEELEKVVVKVASRELRHITVLGGVLGFLIGLVQMGVVYLFVLTKS